MTTTKTEIEVMPIGDAAWVVGGTTDPSAARDAIVDYLLLTGAAPNAGAARTDLAHVVTIAREDWFWRLHDSGGEVLCVESTGKPWGTASRSDRKGLMPERSDAFRGVYVA
ncbi:hypothetical protein [Nocardioides nanhaiensis]|uniref:DUF1508 domain-containing protein n=1 Tax=Nocardioides nanhaiensis TaxID=1476871 RepID=A0ABP8W3F2_9ACTN